ncbi:ARS-binding protein 2 [Naviculisporaceae sp. PSN 640]
MQRISEQSVFTASPTSIHPDPASVSAPAPSTRPPLPDRNVTGSTIENAYVSFILHCNPAVPPDTDSAALREAFMTPPKSGGKSFSTFTLFELIKQLETKELKTWAELALKLGVEPPDQEKGQSSQKIQQYAVRLKRWMHSMHVDAFFEYLMGRSHPYWTDIPADDTPITEVDRDGVAAEDDMALRALLPQIKPRRGRRRPDEDEVNKSPSQRPSPQADDSTSVGGVVGGSNQPNQDSQEPWTAQPVERGSVFLFPPPGQARLHPPAPSWGNNDSLQTPLTAYPQPHSAITPSTRNSFWADEPKSAITPSKARSRRHGAKVVSSAWRIGGSSASGKTRGRPPNSRVGINDGPFSAFPATSNGSDVLTFKLPSPTPDRNAVPVPQSAITPTSGATFPPGRQEPSPPPPPPPGPSPNSAPQQSQHSSQQQLQQQSQQESVVPPRPAKRSRLSLQVPERVGGEVRLATPPLPAPPLSAPARSPPVVMVNGIPPLQPQANMAQPPENTGFPTSPATKPWFLSSANKAQIRRQQTVSFTDKNNHTNKYEMESFFVHQILSGDWFSRSGDAIAPCSVEEAWALAQTVVDNLLKTADTKEAFLINLAALAGGKLLMPANGLKITRLEAEPGKTRYSFDWQLQYGDIRGSFSMKETVLDEKWKNGVTTNVDNNSNSGGAVATTSVTAGENESQQDEASMWKTRYEEMSRRYEATSKVLHQRDQELDRLRSMIVGALKGSRQPVAALPVDN